MARVVFTTVDGVDFICGNIVGEPYETNAHYSGSMVADTFYKSQFILPNDVSTKSASKTFTFNNSDGEQTIWDGLKTGNGAYSYANRFTKGSHSSWAAQVSGQNSSRESYMFVGLDGENIKYVAYIDKTIFENSAEDSGFYAYRWDDDSSGSSWNYFDIRYIKDITTKSIISEGDLISFEFTNTPYIASSPGTVELSFMIHFDTGESYTFSSEGIDMFIESGMLSIDIEKENESDDITLGDDGVINVGTVSSKNFTIKASILDESGNPMLYASTVVSITELVHLILSPSLSYISEGEEKQFSAIGEFDDGQTKDLTELASWGLGRNTIDEPVSELDGFTITQNGLVTAINPTVSAITVSAKAGGIGQYTTLYVSDFPGNYDPGGTTGTGGASTGGGGAFGKNEVSDSIDIPSGSVAGDASATGMYTRYLANSSYLDAIGDWLWSTDLGLQIAKTVISAIYGNPAESVISLMSYPFNISGLTGVTSRTQNLVWGNHDSGISAIALTSQAATIDWGTITLEEYWGNFLDYEPHTKIELYLPWGTGFVSIDPNMCLPGSLHVVTNIDLSKGSCVHNVFGNNNVVIGTYAGQCSQQIPIMSNDYASKVAGVVVSATALSVSGAAGGAASTAGAKAEQAYGATHSMPFGDPKGIAAYKAGIAEAASEAQAPYRATQRTAARLAAGSSVAAFKRSGIISRNGSFTDGSAALGVQYPYIILSRPSQSVPKQYGSHYGYPSNIYTRLGFIRGYTEVGEIHLDGIAGTDAEIAELDSILKGGVIF